MTEVKENFYLGCDVGCTGGFAILNQNGNAVETAAFTNFSDFADSITRHFGADREHLFAVVEKVSAMPGQGVVSMFTFGGNYGGWQATMQLLKIPHELIPPQKWQKEILGVFPKGLSKEKALQFAQRRWPALNLLKKDHGVVDALCIAEYARRLQLGMFTRESEMPQTSSVRLKAL